MLDQLINLGKQQLGQSLKENQNLNDKQVGDAFDVAKDSFFEGIKNQAMSGNISQLTSLFNGNQNNSSALTNEVIKHLVPNLTSKLGVSEDKAGSIANMVVPFLVNKFASKETGTANNDQGLMGMLGLDTGNLLSGLGGKLGGLFN